MKDSILLLHGALGSKDQFASLIEKLKDEFDVHTFNFFGHGGNEFSDGFSIDGFIKETMNFIYSNHLESTNVFGYSMGGYVALKAAILYPLRFKKIITLGTKFNWTPETAAKETGRLIPEVIVEKIPKFADDLQKRHHPQDWKKLMNHTAAMIVALGNSDAIKDEDFSTIQNEVLICVGSEDNMVTLEESMAVVNHLPNGHLKVINGFKHPIEAVDQNVLAKIISLREA